MQQVRVDEVNDEGGLLELRDEWNELLANSRSDSLFLTWEWLYHWLRQLGGDLRPSIVTLRQGGDLIGLAPFIRRRGLVGSIELMGTGSVGSDYLDVIARDGHESLVVGALADLLAERGQQLHLRQLRAGDSVAFRLARELDGCGWSHARRVVNACPWIDLGAHDSWDDYLATLSSSHRYNFRRRTRQLEREYAMSFERAETTEECAAALEILIELHRARWDEKGGSNALHRPDLCAFHRDFTRDAHHRGWLRLYVLRLDGKPAAALYGFRYADRFFFYQSGFEPEYEKRSPSLVTLGLSIEAAMAEGVREYDLLHGRERYKFHWASREHELEDIECHPPGAVAALVRGARELSRSSKSFARQILPEPVTTAITNFRERTS